VEKCSETVVTGRNKVENQERHGVKKVWKQNKIKPSPQLVIMTTMRSSGDNLCCFKRKLLYIQQNKQSPAASEGLPRNTYY
jgi:hypothetical protein